MEHEHEFKMDIMPRHIDRRPGLQKIHARSQSLDNRLLDAYRLKRPHRLIGDLAAYVLLYQSDFGGASHT